MRYVDAFKNGRRNKTVFDDLRAVVHLGGVGFVRVDSHVDTNAHKAHRAVRIGFLGSCSLRPDSAERDPPRHERRPDASAKTAQGRRDEQGGRIAAPLRFRDPV